jgi:hypothetical protein
MEMLSNKNKIGEKSKDSGRSGVTESSSSRFGGVVGDLADLALLLNKLDCKTSGANAMAKRQCAYD